MVSVEPPQPRSQRLWRVARRRLLSTLKHTLKHIVRCTGGFDSSGDGNLLSDTTNVNSGLSIILTRILADVRLAEDALSAL